MKKDSKRDPIPFFNYEILREVLISIPTSKLLSKIFMVGRINEG
jgi:hypothetical protein